MTETRGPYPPEVRRQMVDLVRSGRDPDDLAREYEACRAVDPQLGRGCWRQTGQPGGEGTGER